MADMQYELSERGSVHISDEVVQIIAGVATNEVDGVLSTSGSLYGGLTESITGRKNMAKGVKVQYDEAGRSCTIDVWVQLRFGVSIPEVGYQIQEHVKSSVESMTGLRVDAVHVHVVGVAFQTDAERAQDADQIGTVFSQEERSSGGIG
ncbi:Asp23/Gls24 family envelope stress response protein [Alicyclobacillus sendaiensis]|uniref:Asp23/Gls24 family envelope stress response protein n=1 Tax=Alicyclobacillus sendaiensis PA2 TaxID=3029425 RepID=A0ABT6XXT6_ALISE|nr:Asp23/Gls24 family envelope stress response protein [Alicyclobacillus sendaiensis]MDI9259904.1 Asp23/Gls24 family envelope stress response protein [Alicyclobacillus sendaiensis PA2]